MTKNGVTQYQIKDLRDDVDTLKVDVRRILENHLPHLHEEIAALRTRVNLLIVAVVVEIGVILLGKFL